MTGFRKFMVRNFVGLNGVRIRLFGKRYTVSWMKGAIFFYLFLVIFVGVAELLLTRYYPKLDWLPFIPAIIFVGIFETVKLYTIKYPMTKDEANWVEKQGYKL